MENTNEMTIIFDSYSSNEAFARVAVAAFMTSLNPTVEEVADVKTAVSEAVTNPLSVRWRSVKAGSGNFNGSRDTSDPDVRIIWSMFDFRRSTCPGFDECSCGIWRTDAGGNIQSFRKC